MKSLRIRRLILVEALTGFSFILPALILFLIFGFIPILMAGYTSLFRVPFLNPDISEYIGFSNYFQIFQDKDFIHAFTNSILFAIYQMPLQTIVGLLLALLVQKSTRSTGFFRTAYFLPVTISYVVASTLWKVMLDSQGGIVNSILIMIGLPAQPFLTSTTQALPSIAVMESWKWVGFTMLIFLAGLKAIPNEFYEAARIDGGNGFQIFRYITLPLLKRPALYVVVTNTIYALKMFTPVFIMSHGGPQNSTLTPVFYIFREAFHYNHLGYASALSFLFTILLLSIAAIQLRILRGGME